MAPTSENSAHSILTRKKPRRLLKTGTEPRVAMAVASDNPPTITPEKANTCQSRWP
jgi:hypothetical protein